MYWVILRINDWWDVVKLIVLCFGFMGFNRCGIDGKRVLVSIFIECILIVIFIVIFVVSVFIMIYVYNCEL